MKFTEAQLEKTFAELLENEKFSTRFVFQSIIYRLYLRFAKIKLRLCRTLQAKFDINLLISKCPVFLLKNWTNDLNLQESNF